MGIWRKNPYFSIFHTFILDYFCMHIFTYIHYWLSLFLLFFVYLRAEQLWQTVFLGINKEMLNVNRNCGWVGFCVQWAHSLPPLGCQAWVWVDSLQCAKPFIVYSCLRLALFVVAARASGPAGWEEFSVNLSLGERCMVWLRLCRFCSRTRGARWGLKATQQNEEFWLSLRNVWSSMLSSLFGNVNNRK